MTGGRDDLDAGPRTANREPRTFPPPCVPLFRFATGHELWRVTDVDRMLAWRSSLSHPDEAGSARLSFCTERAHSPTEGDVDRGIFVLTREGRPVRFLWLEPKDGRPGSNPYDQPYCCLKPALPGHPLEDPDGVLRMFRWVVDTFFPGGPSIWPAHPSGTPTWYETTMPVLSGQELGVVLLLEKGDEELCAEIGNPPPYAFRLERFLEWVSMPSVK